MFRFNGNRKSASAYEAPVDAEGRRAIIDVRDITKVYKMGDIEVHALRGLSLKIYEGEFVSIMGPSGSGKSTLMNILGALDQPTDGEYYLDGVDVSKANENDLAHIRNQKIGFVFQSFNLLKRTVALRQVELPLIYTPNAGNRRDRAEKALHAVGLGNRMDHLPNELSGGQQQRVAIARAIVTEPAMVLADEPTGNLDSKSGTDVLRIFQEMNQEQGITTIFVTHDAFIARHTDRVIMLRDGKVVADKRVAEPLIAGVAERPSELAELEDIFRETYEAPAEEFN
jgi:putative ABC transport system ATP-binding protein